MPNETGVIEGILDKKVLVRVRKSSACENCETRDACHVVGDKDMMIEVANDIQAEEGDHVEISVPTRSLMKISLLVYILPIAALIVGALIGESWSHFFHIRSASASILGGGIALGITFLVLKWFNRSVESKPEYHPRMTRILFRADLPTLEEDSGTRA